MGIARNENAPNYAPKTIKIAIDQDGLLWTKKRPEPLISQGFLAFGGMLRNGKWWWNTEPNPRPLSELNGNTLALRAWI